jgi:hypothetical protein
MEITSTSIRECDFIIHWNSEKVMAWEQLTCMFPARVCTSMRWHIVVTSSQPVGQQFLVWQSLVPSALKESMATSNLVKGLLIALTFLLRFLFWKRCLPFPSSVSSCTTSELTASPSQDLTESDHIHIFFNGMGLFAFSLTVWACLWLSAFHYIYFIYIYVNIFRSIEPVPVE